VIVWGNRNLDFDEFAHLALCTRWHYNTNHSGDFLKVFKQGCECLNLDSTLRASGDLVVVITMSNS